LSQKKKKNLKIMKDPLKREQSMKDSWRKKSHQYTEI